MTEDGRDYPDGLTPAERRVLDYVRAGTLDAEIAVRLGVPIGDVKERVASILRKTGARGRAALVEWAAPPEPVEADDSPVDPIVPEAEATAPQAPRRLSRRKLVGALAGLGALAAGGTAAALLVRRDDSPAVSAGPSETVTSAAGATPALFEPVDDAFEYREFAPGESIDWEHGLFTMDLNSGAVFGWRLRTDGAAQPFAFDYRLTGGAITCTGEEHGWMHYTGSGASYRWRLDELRLVASLAAQGPGGVSAFLFERQLPADGSRRRHYELLRGQPGAPMATLVVGPSDQMVTEPLISPDGSRVAFWTWPSGGPLRVVVQSADGVFSREAEIVGAGSLPELLPAPFLPVKGIAHFDAFVRVRAEGSSSVRLQRFDWDGLPQGPVREIASVWLPDVAPGGATMVTEDWLLQSNPAGMDYFIWQWPAVDVWGADGGRLFRVRSASLLYGDALDGSRWLADSRGFVALVNSREEDATLGARLAYAVVAADGDEVERLDIPPSPGDRWWEQAISRAPTPSPFDSDWFALGRLEAWNPRTGRHLVANLAGQGGPAHYGPWSGEGKTFVFALPHGGHDGAFPPILLNALVEREDYATDFPLKVRAGDCLNLRDAPGRDGAVAVCLAPATQLELVRDDTAATAAIADGATWVRVRAGEREGWVSTSYLEWA